MFCKNHISRYLKMYECVFGNNSVSCFFSKIKIDISNKLNVNFKLIALNSHYN